MPARVSCNINFAKKFAIGRQDRKRNPAVVTSGEGDRPYEYFMQYLSVKIGKYSWGSRRGVRRILTRASELKEILLLFDVSTLRSACRSAIGYLAGQLGVRKKRKE